MSDTCLVRVERFRDADGRPACASSVGVCLLDCCEHQLAIPDENWNFINRPGDGCPVWTNQCDLCANWRTNLDRPGVNKPEGWVGTVYNCCVVDGAIPIDGICDKPGRFEAKGEDHE